MLESEPYRRLSYTWHTTTPEWRAMAREKIGFDEELLDRIAAEPRSKATFEIEDLGELVKLTVIHDGFEAGSEVLPTISQGWPYIISNLKTLLETGDMLPHQHRHRRSRPRILLRPHALLPPVHLDSCSGFFPSS